MTVRTFVRCCSLLALTLVFASCLKGEKVVVPPDKCLCTGVLCLNGEVSRRSPAPDNGEGDNPCLTCQYAPLGTCAEGCTEETSEVEGCAVAYACKTWSRVAPGATCAIDRDCEPGQVDGQAANTLVCDANLCTDVGAEKFKDLTALACPDATFGASTFCGGRACLGQDEYATSFTCSAARCVEDGDCPTGWHCRCAEEYVTRGVKGWRWCVPDVVATPDAGEQ